MISKTVKTKAIATLLAYNKIALTYWIMVIGISIANADWIDRTDSS